MLPEVVGRRNVLPGTRGVAKARKAESDAAVATEAQDARRERARQHVAPPHHRAPINKESQ
jgi:hypothetical protein